MSVKYIYNSPFTTLNPALKSACTPVSNGQVEDYTIEVEEDLGVDDVIGKSSLSIAPNPFTNTLMISEPNKVKSVQFTDLTGRHIKTLDAASELNVSDLKPDIYLITLLMDV
ncbi:T9SS type A sorting domain-containing protein [Vaginella massiliensis]|uniref:T9SS type A sorting domain-containing protein n=1 Tax=Vaginella massiliensis TaxID=1816680 RepID=UPI00375166AF